MESALGLYKDTPDPTTHKYERTEAKLAAGPCYVKWMTGSNAGQYELRRYTTGAAFFKKARKGDWREILDSDEDIHRYNDRAAALASPELLAWMHRS